jgi:hypothetical protein
MRRLLIALSILAVAALPASPRVMVVFRLASPPLPVEAGQQFALCAANVGATNVDLTLQFVSVRTGAVAASKDVVLPAPGAGSPMPDPCLVTPAETIASAGTPQPNEPAMVVGLVVMKRGLFARATAATAAIQVTTLAPTGERKLLASVPLLMATAINGRNTPIEKVK